MPAASSSVNRGGPRARTPISSAIDRGRWSVFVAQHLDFRKLRMVVAHPRDHDGELLIRHLQRLGCRVDVAWPPGGSLEGEVDVLLCLVDPAARALLDAATAQAGPAVIGVIDPR